MRGHAPRPGNVAPLFFVESHMNKIASPYRKAAWGCYRIAGRVSDRIALCRDFEGHFEKPFAEIANDAVITEAEYLAAENRRAEQRFDSSLAAWERDLLR